MRGLEVKLCWPQWQRELHQNRSIREAGIDPVITSQGWHPLLTMGGVLDCPQRQQEGRTETARRGLVAGQIEPKEKGGLLTPDLGGTYLSILGTPLPTPQGFLVFPYRGQKSCPAPAVSGSATTQADEVVLLGEHSWGTVQRSCL